MEHVTIISQEAITRDLFWPTAVVGVAAILFALTAVLYQIIKPKNVNDRAFCLCLHSVTCIGLMIISSIICSVCFQVKTGLYKYEGTFDSDMSIVEFEEFYKQYDNVRFEDNVWKWQDKE